MPADRRKYRPSIMQAVLSIMLTVLVGSFAYILLFVGIPIANNEVLILIIGLIAGEWKNAMSYWWQSTRSSEMKNGMLANSIPIAAKDQEDKHD